MTTDIIELQNIIDNNDYDKLENIITNNPNINGDLFYKQSYKTTPMDALARSVYKRSYECFDLLLSIKNISVNKAFNIALDYYINAPNVKNLYFFERLLLKNVIIVPRHIIRAKNNIELFNSLFNKMEKTVDNIHILLCDIINDMDKFTYLFNYVKNNYPNSVAEITNGVLIEAIENDKIDIIIFLKSMDINIYSITHMGIQIPSLFYLYSEFSCRYSRSTFDLLIKYYKLLSPDELRNIPNISNIIYLMKENPHNNNIFDELMNILDLLINVINFDNLLISIFNYIINNCDKHIILNLFILYYILYNKKINIESFIFMTDETIAKYIVLLNKFDIKAFRNNYTFQNLKKILINLCYILEHFDISILSLFDGIFSTLFTIHDNKNDLSKFNELKLNYICHFNNIIKNKKL